MYQLKLGEMSARDQTRGISMLGCTGNARLRGKLRGSRWSLVKREVYVTRAAIIILIM